MSPPANEAYALYTPITPTGLFFFFFFAVFTFTSETLLNPFGDSSQKT